MPINTVMSGSGKNLSQNIVDALNAADNPSGSNPFLTDTDVPLSQNILDALNGANAPTAGNVFATISDISQTGISQIGTVIQAPVNPDPTKWLEMNGSWVSRAAWPSLSALIPAAQFSAPPKEFLFDAGGVRPYDLPAFASDGNEFVGVSSESPRKVFKGTPGNWTQSNTSGLPALSNPILVFDGAYWVIKSSTNIYYASDPLTAWTGPVALGFTATSMVAARGIVLACDSATNLQYSLDHGATWNAIAWPAVLTNVASCNIAVTPTGFVIVGLYTSGTVLRYVCAYALDGDLATWNLGGSIDEDDTSGAGAYLSVSGIISSSSGLLMYTTSLRAYFSWNFGLTWKYVNLPYTVTHKTKSLVTCPAFVLLNSPSTTESLMTSYDGVLWNVSQSNNSLAYGVAVSNNIACVHNQYGANVNPRGLSTPYDAVNMYIQSPDRLFYPFVKCFVKAA